MICEPKREQAADLRQMVRHGRIIGLVAVVLAVGTGSGFAAVRDLGPFAKARESRTVEGVRFSFSVPRSDYTEAWENGPLERVGGKLRIRSLYISKSIERGQAAEAVIFWTGFRDRRDASPCAKLLSRAVDRSTTDLAAAVARAPGTKLVAGPRRVTVGGRPAQYVVQTVREDLGCDPGFFFTWRSPWWGAFWPGTSVGTTIRVWIVDVHRVRLFIEAEISKPSPGQPAPIRAEFKKVEQEITKIVGSIRFHAARSGAAPATAPRVGSGFCTSGLQDRVRAQQRARVGQGGRVRDERRRERAAQSVAGAGAG
jgi:hypothetical protein